MNSQHSSPQLESLKSHYLEHFKSEIMETESEQNSKNQETLNSGSAGEKEENPRQGEEENCQYCGKHFDNMLSLLGCYTQHFKTELKNVCQSLLDFQQDQQCPFCSENFEHFDSLTCHLGTVHLLVNDFLIQEGVKPLVPSNEDYDIYFDSREI